MNLFLLSDLDRTILPNGAQKEAVWARPLLGKLAGEDGVKLAYVSGRDAQLVQKAIADYDLPQPDFVVADVGTSIYKVVAGNWQAMREWSSLIADDWQGRKWTEIYPFLQDLDFITLQETDKQGDFKLSFYIDPQADFEKCADIVQQKLNITNIKTAIICSIDETKNIAFLDVLPRNATKLHAIRFLIKHTGFLLDNVVYAGDSGNDLPVLESNIQSVLVANATPAMKEQATDAARIKGNIASLYIAGGGVVGNYAAGVLNGAAHYLPLVKKWLYLSTK